MPQLLLHHSRCYTVCEQGTSSTVSHRMEPASWYSQFVEQRVQNFFPQLVGRERTTAPVLRNSRPVLLEPDSAYAVANQLASQQGESLSVSKKALWKRLREKGYLAQFGAEDGRNTLVRTIGARRQRVLCVLKKYIIELIRA